MIPVKIEPKGDDRLVLNFAYNPSIIEEVKCMEGAKWHGRDDPARKVWSVNNSFRNRFRLAYLQWPAQNDPRNPYYNWNQPLKDFKTNRSLYAHQRHMAQAGLTYHYEIFGAEMGTGKTLAAIEVMENSKNPYWFWVAPKSALVAAQLEFRKWKCYVQPLWYTYEQLVKAVKDWPKGTKPPAGIVFDESSRAKNHQSQRSQACQYIADAIRREWGWFGFVIEMSGSPAPKSPLDWWSQCEIAMPGFIREGDVVKFRKRLAIMELKEGFHGGGMFNSLVSWKDDEKKCDVCGLFEDAETHRNAIDVHQVEDTSTCHNFVPSVNEVSLLYKRVVGLVTVKFKKDCLDLPDKQYKIIRCPVSRSTLNSAAMITARCSSAIQALTLLRELSDGFQYTEEMFGTEKCPRCNGERFVTEMVDENDPLNPPTQEEIVHGIRMVYENPDSEDGEERAIWHAGSRLKMIEQRASCPKCDGIGTVDHFRRAPVFVSSPKEEVLREILEEHEDIGRIGIFAGFTGSIDRVTSIVQSCGWNLIRVDGRGWMSDMPAVKKPLDMITAFQEGQGIYPKIAFTGQPGAGGLGLTLTASPTLVYYSNDFNGESRVQSEDRIHRIGMDVNRGAMIIDILHLPSDELVLRNLQKKRKLQEMSMGEMNEALKSIDMQLSERII